MQRLRRLGVDDMIILRCLVLGQSVTETAKTLSITQPAVTQRIRKMCFVFGGDIIKRKFQGCDITPLGAKLGGMAINALEILEETLVSVHDTVEKQ